MGTPIKNISKLLSPRILSPVSPNFLNVLNTGIGKSHERKTPASRKIEFLGQNQKCLKNAITPVKIKITVSDDLFKDVKKCDLLINTPNKNRFIKNGIRNEKLFNVLGRGSFGKVFKAVHKDRIVAMKLVKKTNFIREKNALNLDHKNIVDTLEIFENETEHYSLILMEYLPDCDTLQNILKSSISFQDLLKYACDISKGINYCHSNKILHLDLKPSNILIVNGVCKICDFGNSVKNIDTMEQFKHHGTIQYTAPEILLGQIPTERSDVYSLGIIFWQLKTKKCPYDDIDNIHCVIYKVVKYKLRPEMQTPSDNFSKLYQECWSQNYNDRPSVSRIIEKLSLNQF